ncbi:MAG: hypothetical protein KatS3mg110_0952 [Pirellulaceae bacterium]|nr:MAG: hypothetical protein KatS3mg110_0952 [Pirellulaceae bacterium]
MSLILLDYGNPNPFRGIIGRPRHLAWPVHVYRVTLPTPPANRPTLNAFERVILTLIDVANIRDIETLAEETCLPQDLVQCVLLRLQDKGYINRYNEIIIGRRDDWMNTNHHSERFATACLFRELATGKILPYIQFLDNTPLQKKEGNHNLYRRIPGCQTHTKSPPSPRDVIVALRSMQKKVTAFWSELRMPSLQQIMIAADTELYYLDCPIAIQKSDGEFRIADPFGNGFSLQLESAFSSLLEKDEELRQWFMNWKIGLAPEEIVNSSASSKEPYDNDLNRARYPNLVSCLRPGRHRRYRSIEQIHAALEWALFYTCVEREYFSAVQELKLTNQSEHTLLLQEAAQKLSLELPEKGFFPIREGKLNDFLGGKAELVTVLSLCLLMAAADTAHPLRRIAAAYPDFITRLLELKKARDELAHGAVNMRPADVELPEDRFMREILTALLPAVRFSDLRHPAADIETLSDILLAARTSIQSEFGFALFNRLGDNLQNRLIACEQFWLSCKDGDDALPLVCDLYAAMQIAFRKSLLGLLPPDISESEYIAIAQQKAKESSLGDLPECFLTVKRSAVRETLSGHDQTLQACFIAFLLVSNPETLLAIAQIQPSFVTDVARVVKLRRHGNEPLPMPKREIVSVRRAAYTTIKKILEA